MVYYLCHCFKNQYVSRLKSYVFSARNEAGSDQIYEDMPGLDHNDIHEPVCISNILF
jgi:hypothetical protein